MTEEEPREALAPGAFLEGLPDCPDIIQVYRGLFLSWLVGYSKCLPRLREELSSNVTDLAKGARGELLLKDAIYCKELS